MDKKWWLRGNVFQQLQIMMSPDPHLTACLETQSSKILVEEQINVTMPFYDEISNYS